MCYNNTIRATTILLYHGYKQKSRTKFKKEKKYMFNKDIRDEIKQAGLKYWQVALAINLNDGNFSRKLRKELSPEEKMKIYQAIKILKEGKENDKNTNH